MPGIYTITNTIVASGGCQTITATTIITILATPLVNAGSDVTINAGSSTVLNAIGAGHYKWFPYEGLSCSNCANPIASPSQTTTYTVTVTDTITGCSASDDVIIVIECGEIFVPTAFSPNNDNANDLECVFGKCIETMRFTIYDRWGEQVFESIDPNICWDGTFKGAPMNTGVFVYSFNATLTNGERINKKGNISLIR